MTEPNIFPALRYIVDAYQALWGYGDPKVPEARDELEKIKELLAAADALTTGGIGTAAEVGTVGWYKTYARLKSAIAACLPGGIRTGGK